MHKATGEKLNCGYGTQWNMTVDKEAQEKDKVKGIVFPQEVTI